LTASTLATTIENGVIEFTIEVEIDRPVADVFAYVTDPATLATWQINTVSVVQEGSGSLGLGTRFREVHRAGGRNLQSLVEVSEYEPDRTFALHVIEGALPVDVRITFEPTGRGTLMRFGAHGQPGGALHLAQPLLRRMLRRQFAGYCRNLKQILEEG
jgi:uncharacterized protein YndB with AHSA1/START domain